MSTPPPPPKRPTPPRVALPAVKTKFVGQVLNPGDPGYEEALAKIRNRQAAGASPQKDKR